MEFAKVPSQGNPLELKLTAAGITQLKTGRFRLRYTGSKKSVIDINGRLHLTKSGFKKYMENEQAERKRYNDWLNGEAYKKKSARKTRPKNLYETCKGTQMSENFSTQQNNLLANSTDLHTKKERKKSYQVNKKEVRQRILGYINTGRGEKHLYFWTVTFFAGMPDDLAYRAFNTWLTSLRQRKMLHDYLWIAERQDGKRLADADKTPTNTLHFHLAIPHKMNVHRANRMMAGTLKTYAKRGGVPFNEFQCRKYNGVDIAKDRKTGRVVNFAKKKAGRSLSNYLSKYVTKNDTKFAHLAWHNSRGYSQLFTGYTITWQEFQRFELWQLTYGAKMKEGDFFKFYPWYGQPPEQFTRHLYELNTYIQNLTETYD